jgi:hypothetical protein
MKTSQQKCLTPAGFADKVYRPTKNKHQSFSYSSTKQNRSEHILAQSWRPASPSHPSQQRTMNTDAEVPTVTSEPNLVAC